MPRTLDISDHRQAEFYYSRWAMLYGFLFAVIWTGIVGTMGWFFFFGPIEAFVMYTFGIFFFGVFALITIVAVLPLGVKSLTHLIYNRPALVLDGEGINLRFKKKKIAWQDIKTIIIKPKGGKKIHCF